MYNERKLPLDQHILLPPDLMEWLPEESLAYTIIDVISDMDMSPFYKKYRNDGKGGKFLDPAVKLSVLIYAYCTGVYSSRKIEESIKYDISFRVLARNNYIDHTTIARFRQEFGEPFSDAFAQVLKILREGGAAKAGIIALDGTKIEANASMEKNKSYDPIQKDVSRILQEAFKIDEEEDELYRYDTGYEQLPGLPKDRIERYEKLMKAKEQLELEQKEKAKEQEEKIKAREEDEEKNGKKRGRKPKPPQYKPDKKLKVNITDPDSKVMKTRKGGYIQGYNAQIIASEDQYIVAHDVTNEQNDRHQLEPMLIKAIEELKKIGVCNENLPRVILADAGYWVYENILALDSMPMEILVSPRNEQNFSEVHECSRTILDMNDFCSTEYLPPCRALIQQIATWVSNTYCECGGKVTGCKEVFKQIMGKIVADSSRKLYSRRKAQVEPVFGQIKTNMGFERFSMRGKEKCQTEWTLVSMAYNVKKGWQNGVFKGLKQGLRNIAQGSVSSVAVC